MLEGVTEKNPSLFWKVLVTAVALLIIGLVALLYFTQETPELRSPLEAVICSDDPDFELYSRQLEFEDRGIQMLKNFTGSRMVLFTGAVTNHSDRTLDVVEVRLILFNAHEPVFESFRTPIRPGPYTPSLLSGETRGFTLYLEDFPKNWWASRAEMEISGFRFAGVDSGTG